MARKKKVQIQETPPAKPLKPLPSAEELADSITEIARTMRAVFQSRLSKKAVVALIRANCNISIANIETVISNLERFDSIWLNEKKP